MKQTDVLKTLPTSDTAREANLAFHEIVLQSKIEEDILDRLIQLVYQENIRCRFSNQEESKEFRREFFQNFLLMQA